jgi:hypothetical protein
MSKEWGKQCDYGVGLCFNGSPTSWCSGQHPCIGGDVGDLGIMDKTPEQIEASTTKFVLDKDDKLLEVGMLKEAGLRVGDTLTGLFTVGEPTIEMSNEDDRKRILTWKVKKPLVSVLYRRDGISLSGTMKNPRG